MKHLALFNGIGGFQLAAHWMGWVNIAHVEIDPFCNKVVAKHFPESKCYLDIKEFKGEQYNGTIDIISGGFPCQPFSVAGKQMGKDDDRNLWSKMFRVIREIHPAWVVGENVANLTNFLEFENTLLDLEAEGYEVQAFIIPASAVGAWHQRKRVWIVAKDTDRFRCNGGFGKEKTKDGGFREFGAGNLQRVYKQENVPNTERSRLPVSGAKRVERQNSKRNKSTNNVTCASHKRGNAKQKHETPEGWEFEPNVGRVANGVPGRVDRLKALGNAIVPQVAFEIFKAIGSYD